MTKVAFFDTAIKKTCVHCGGEFKLKRIDAVYCSTACGNKVRHERFRPSPAAQERKLALQRLRRATVEGKFFAHKEGAKQRDIPFTLTFEEWWALWKPHWRDKLQGQICMCRKNDTGGYELGNVRIDTWQNNIRESRGLPLV